jgi:excisionase family DNA binding protein
MSVSILSPAAEPAQAPALLDVEAVAALCGCSPRHVYRLADAGRMPAPRKLGALCRWSRAEIAAWIDAGCRPVRHTPARSGVRS